MKTFVLGPHSLKTRLEELTSGEVFFVESRTDLLNQISNLDRILYLELTDVINFDLAYFLKHSVGNSLGLFYTKNTGKDLLFIDPDYKLYQEKDTSSYFDGFISAGVYLGTPKNLTQIFSGNYSGVIGIPLGKNNNYHDFQKLQAALFLDRDGVINVDLGYLYQKEKAILCEEVIPLIQKANNEGMPVIVLTNQSGVAKGWYREEDVLNLHEFLNEKIAQFGARIDGWYFSPFHPTSGLIEYNKKSFLRKPGPGMALLACEKFPIDLSRSYMVGDKVSDNLQIKGLNCLNLNRGYDLGESKFPIFQTYEELSRFIFG